MPRLFAAWRSPRGCPLGIDPLQHPSCDPPALPLPLSSRFPRRRSGAERKWYASGIDAKGNSELLYLWARGTPMVAFQDMTVIGTIMSKAPSPFSLDNG